MLQPVQVRKGDQGEDPRGVLRQPPIPQLREAPQPLDGMKRMLDHGAHARPGPVDGIPVARPLATLVDQVPAPAELLLQLVFGFVVRLVAVERYPLAVQ